MKIEEIEMELSIELENQFVRGSFDDDGVLSVARRGAEVNIVWPALAPGEWLRFELSSDPIDLESYKYLKFEAVLQSVTNARLDVLYLIFRPADGSEETAFSLTEQHKFTGGLDSLWILLAVPGECRRMGILTVAFQCSHALDVDISKLSLIASSSDEILQFKPPAQARPATAKSYEGSKIDRSIVVCVHNSWYCSEPCLRAVFAHREPNDVVVLVNDGSTPEVSGRLRRLAASQSRTVYVEDRTGSGYTKAVNRGISLTDSEYVILLNSDTLVPPDWTNRLVRPFAERGEIGIVGPLSNRATIQSVPAIEELGTWAKNELITPENLVQCDEITRLVASRLCKSYLDVKVVNGFCLAIKREVFEQIGLFDERVFSTGYGEETDFQLRALAAGYECAVVPDLLVYHLGSASYENYDVKMYQELAFRLVSLKHGVSRVMDAYLASKETLENLESRDVLSVLFRSQSLISKTAGSTVDSEMRRKRVLAMMEMLVPNSPTPLIVPVGV